MKCPCDSCLETKCKFKECMKEITRILIENNRAEEFPFLTLSCYLKEEKEKESVKSV